MASIGIGVGDKVVECKHCNGTGICGRAIFHFNKDGNSFRQCDKCGTGVSTKWVVKSPTCAVCGGVGQVRV